MIKSFPLFITSFLVAFDLLGEVIHAIAFAEYVHRGAVQRSAEDLGLVVGDFNDFKT